MLLYPATAIGITGLVGEMAVKFGARSTYINCAKLQQGQRQLTILGCFYFHTGELAAEAHLSIFYCPNSIQRLPPIFCLDKKVTFCQNTMDVHENYISYLVIQ